MRDMVRFFSFLWRCQNANADADKPDELLESDSKYPKGQNPMIADDSIPEGKASK